MQPLVIDYLKTHSLQELMDEHGVVARINIIRQKICLNYDMLQFKPGDKLAEECRGLIIRPNDFNYLAIDFDKRIVGDSKILSWPMNKFYNQGEFHAATIEQSTMKLREKLDGTMISLYWDSLWSEWCVSTRGVAEADIPIRLGDIILEDKTFHDLFVDSAISAMKRKNFELDSLADFAKINDLQQDCTYVFELTTPFNKVVVDYVVNNVTLIAVRNIVSGLEDDIDLIKTYIDRPTNYDLKDFSAIAAFADTFEPNVLEGFVVCDHHFNRVKIKNSKWVFASRAKDGVVSSKRNALLACLDGTLDDILPFVDVTTRSILTKMSSSVQLLIEKTEAQYKLLNEISGDDMKGFACTLDTMHSPLRSAFFAVKRNKAKNIRAYIHNLIEQKRITDSFLDSILSYLKHNDDI